MSSVLIRRIWCLVLVASKDCPVLTLRSWFTCIFKKIYKFSFRKFFKNICHRVLDSKVIYSFAVENSITHASRTIQYQSFAWCWKFVNSKGMYSAIYETDFLH